MADELDFGDVDPETVARDINKFDRENLPLITLNTVPAVRWLQEEIRAGRKDKADLDRLVEGTGQDLAFFLGWDNVMDVDTWHAFCTNVQLICEDPEAMGKIAQDSERFYKAHFFPRKELGFWRAVWYACRNLGHFLEYGPALSVAKFARSSKEIVEMFPSLNTMYNCNSKAMVGEVSHTHAVVYWSFFKDVRHRLDLNDCRQVANVVRAFPTTYGRKLAKLTEPVCCVPVDGIDCIQVDGQHYGYSTEERVVSRYLVDPKTLQQIGDPEHVGELEGDGTFEINGRHYGGEACAYHLEFEKMPLWRRAVNSTFMLFPKWYALGKEKRRQRRYRDMLLRVALDSVEELKGANAKLRVTHDELRGAHRELETYVGQVEERANTLAGQLVQTEKMATVGGLVSGFAHNMNTHLGGLAQVVSGYENHLRTFLESGLNVARLGLSHEHSATYESAITAVSRVGFIDQTVMSEMRTYLKRGYGLSRQDAGTLAALGLSGEVLSKLIPVMGQYDFDTMLGFLNSVRTVSVMFKGVGVNAEQMGNLIKSLETFYRPETRLVDGYDVTSGIDDALTVLHDDLSDAHVEVETHYGPNLPGIRCYAGEIPPVWVNIIRNAKDALEGRTGGRIVVNVDSDGKYVHVSIADNGLGITEDVLPKVFDPFFTTKDPSKGVGVGLATCYETVAARHNGRIEANSIPGETVFDVYLPIGGVEDGR